MGVEKELCATVLYFVLSYFLVLSSLKSSVSGKHCQLQGFQVTACLVTEHDVCDLSGLLYKLINSLLCFNMIIEIIFFNTGPTPKGSTISDTEISVLTFSNVNLTCLIDWHPEYVVAHNCPADQSWYLSREDLPTTGVKYHQYLEDTSSKCKKNLVLSIFNVTENDEGTYGCHFLCEGRNTTKAAIDLKVLFQPPTGNVRKLFFMVKCKQDALAGRLVD